MTEIKVPHSYKQNNRKLKEGYLEEDTIELAHFNLSLMWVNLWFLMLSVVCLIVGYVWSLQYDYYPTTQELRKGWVKFYGDAIFICQTKGGRSTKDDLVSPIQLFELNVPGNVLLRMAIGYPMIVRIANSIVVKSLVTSRNPNAGIFVRSFLNWLPWITTTELFAAYMFSAVTTHQDSNIYHHKFKTLFAYSSCLHMILSTFVMGSASINERSVKSAISFFSKALCTAVYCATMYSYSTDLFRSWNICSSYLPRYSAYKEYILLLTYLIFYLTTIYDLRNVRYVGMPRACAGETEPLDPANFQKGAKFEFCRAFEYNQRKKMKTILIDPLNYY